MADRGRPTHCKPDNVEQARRMCLPGATNQELADLFEVDRSTMDYWLKAHPEFAAAIYEGRDGADAGMARKLSDVWACTFWLRTSPLPGRPEPGAGGRSGQPGRVRCHCRAGTP